MDTHDQRVAAAIEAGGKAGLLTGVRQETVDWTAPPPHGRRRVVLRFHSAPERVVGDDEVRGLLVGGGTEIVTGQVVRAVGYRGTQLAGLPFDDATGTVPNTNGRVRPGTYVVGWIKRGPNGGIGANKSCAADTVGALLDDAAAGLLTAKPRRRGLLRRA